jgi:hypothetical protein
MAVISPPNEITFAVSAIPVSGQYLPLFAGFMPFMGFFGIGGAAFAIALPAAGFFFISTS